MKLAVCCYDTHWGTDHILFRTEVEDLAHLPPITNALLETAGVNDSDVEGDDCTEDASWESLLSIEELPTV